MGFKFNPLGPPFDDPGLVNPVNHIQWILTPTIAAHAEGMMHWDSDSGTLELGMPGGNVKLQIGQEVYLPDRPKNNQGLGMVNGQAVYLSGATGAVPSVKLANASETNAAKTLAVATENVSDQQRGYFTTFGVVREMDTSFGGDGAEVFLDDVDGGLTTDKLSHPNFRVKIGYIIRSHATEGVLFVNIGPEQWLKRMQAMTEPTGFDRNNPDLMGDIAFDAGTRTFSIAVKAGQDYFSFWSLAKEYRKTSTEEVIITDTAGLWYFYYSTSGVLTASQTPWEFQQGLALVAILYWDAVNKENLGLGEERHGIVMDGATHEYLHELNGAVWESGFTPSVTVDGNGSLNAHAEIQGVGAGVFDDEDIEHNSVEQTSSFIMLYKESSGAYFRKEILGNALVAITNVRPDYNEFAGGSWSRTEVASTKFTLTHLFVTNSVNDSKNILVMGGNQYNSKSDAQDGAKVELTSLVTGALPTPEFIAVASFIIECKDSYTNIYNARVVSTSDGGDFVDFRTSEKTGVGAVATDHGNLAGLTDDDHLQYFRTDGTRVATGDFDLGLYSITFTYGKVRGYYTDASDFGVVINSETANPFYFDASSGLMTVPGSVEPTNNGVQELGKSSLRFSIGYINNLSDGTSSLTPTEALTAYTHSQGDGSDHSDVASNTAARHDAATVSDTSSIDMSITGQQISGAVIPGGVDHDSLGDVHQGVTPTDRPEFEAIKLTPSNDPTTTSKGDLAYDDDDTAVVSNNGTDEFVVGAKKKTLSFSVQDPSNIKTHSGRGTKSYPVFLNNTGFTMNITKITANSDTDDYEFNLYKSESQSDISVANDVLLHNIICSDNGTECFYAEIATPTEDAVEDGKWIIFDHDSVVANVVSFSIEYWLETVSAINSFVLEDGNNFVFEDGNNFIMEN